MAKMLLVWVPHVPCPRLGVCMGCEYHVQRVAGLSRISLDPVLGCAVYFDVGEFTACFDATRRCLFRAPMRRAKM